MLLLYITKQYNSLVNIRESSATLGVHFIWYSGGGVFCSLKDTHLSNLNNHHHIQFQSVWFTCASEAIVFVTLSVVTFTVLSRHPPVFGIADTLTTVTGTCNEQVEKIHFPNLGLSGRGTLDPLFPLQSEHPVTVFNNTDFGHPTRDDWSSWWKVEADRWGRGGAQKATVQGRRWGKVVLLSEGSRIWRMNTLIFIFTPRSVPQGRTNYTVYFWSFNVTQHRRCCVVSSAA